MLFRNVLQYDEKNAPVFAEYSHMWNVAPIHECLLPQTNYCSSALSAWCEGYLLRYSHTSWDYNVFFFWKYKTSSFHILLQKNPYGVQICEFPDAYILHLHLLNIKQLIYSKPGDHTENVQ